VDTFSVSLKLTAAELVILEDFFITECSCGATAFAWRHPRTGASASCRFVDSPSVAWLDGLYRATFTMEVLP
jgi:phage-related protein